MGTTQAAELLKQWKLEELSLERGMGQVLQHLVQLQQTLATIEAEQIQQANRLAACHLSLAHLRDDVDGLIAHTAMPPHRKAPRGLKKRGGNPNLTES